MFIVAGEPISSRTVAERGRLDVSSATIRNTMAELEELGYLQQPHASSGRVPTPAGYHFYIGALMHHRDVTPEERRYIESYLDESTDADDRLVAASKLLSELSRQVGLVLIPALGETPLRAVDFVQLSDRRVLCVMVSVGGFIDTKVVELDEEIRQSELRRAANYVNEHFGGCTMREIREGLLELMDDERAQVDRMLRLVLELGRQGLQSDTDPELVLGDTTDLLNRPELGDVDRVRRIFEAFNEKARLVQLLNQCVDGSCVRVLIGDDSELTSELDFSLVATSYSTGGEVQGSLGILGPTRMEYDRVIPLVEYLAGRLSTALHDSAWE